MSLTSRNSIYDTKSYQMNVMTYVCVNRIVSLVVCVVMSSIIYRLLFKCPCMVMFQASEAALSG